MPKYDIATQLRVYIEDYTEQVRAESRTQDETVRLQHCDKARDAAQVIANYPGSDPMQRQAWQAIAEHWDTGGKWR